MLLPRAPRAAGRDLGLLEIILGGRDGPVHHSGRELNHNHRDGEGARLWGQQQAGKLEYGHYYIRIHLHFDLSHQILAVE